MTYIAGIDEAGRGPVIGPMVMAIVACEDESKLANIGAKDSKQLNPQQRERIARDIRESFPYESIALTPAQIDEAVLGKASGDNLNQLEARTTALLIYTLAKRIPLQRVVLDSPTRTTEKYEAAVRAALTKLDKEGVTHAIKLVAETKADANHPAVGAASIIAKTERDEYIATLSKAHGALGSGYPSDPDTQSFLEKNWREPHDFFRRSWESYQRLAQGRSQATLGDFGAASRAQLAAKFEPLLRHGFHAEQPTNQYEIARLRNDAGVTIIGYTTGKILVQGPETGKATAEYLVQTLELGTSSRRGRPHKTA